MLIVVTGPTAVGKTELCLRLAQQFNAPIVNADSRQLYREMKIGTARPTDAQLSEACFYFVACKSVRDYYSASMYEQEAMAVLNDIFSKGNIAILSGGSMMYVDAVVNGIDDIPAVPSEVRAAVRQRLQNDGLEAMCEELKRLDPDYYEVADLKNPRRVAHAVEICIAAGKPYSSYRTLTRKQRPFGVVKIGLNLPRAELFERINSRVDSMMAAGLADEARQLYPLRAFDAMNTVGYKELFKWLDGGWDLDTAVARIKKHTRVYAKKQLTWYKRDNDIVWFSPQNYDDIVKFIYNRIRGNS